MLLPDRGEKRQGRLLGLGALRHMAVGAIVAMLAIAPASAETIRVAKTIGVIWALTPVDIAQQTGIFAREGLQVEISTLAGDPKVIEGFVGGNFDMALASGTSMMFAVKGAPIRGVAALNGAPRNFSLIVLPDSPIHDAADLKGKKLGTATVASFPEYLARRIAAAQGWGIDDIQTVVTGNPQGTMAAMKLGHTDGFVGATELGYQLAENHAGRIVFGLEKFVPHVHTHVVIASQSFIADHPDAVRKFLAGIFEAVAFMRSNRERTIEISSAVMHMSPAVIAKTYDYELSMMLKDGNFDPTAIQVLKDSFVSMKLLPAAPSDEQLFTRQFVPVKF
jgi:ABC-type nitrate/sulfonate/bicarbonate transport system substrate-binding protein